MSAGSALRTTAIRIAPAALAVLVGRYLAADAPLSDFVLQPLHLALLAYLAVAAVLLVRADRARRVEDERGRSRISDA